MLAIKPIKQKELIRFLRKLDFIGPYSGGKHQFMVKGDLRVRIPNPHKKDIADFAKFKIFGMAKMSQTI